VLKLACPAVLLLVSITPRLPGASNSNFDDNDWWRHAVIYEVYPRSFADSNGDGIGDLNGITEHSDYLKSLGVNGVWITPFYPSRQRKCSATRR
jgi:alpha-glucosidase